MAFVSLHFLLWLSSLCGSFYGGLYFSRTCSSSVCLYFAEEHTHRWNCHLSLISICPFSLLAHTHPCPFSSLSLKAPFFYFVSFSVLVVLYLSASFYFDIVPLRFVFSVFPSLSPSFFLLSSFTCSFFFFSFLFVSLIFLFCLPLFPSSLFPSSLFHPLFLPSICLTLAMF